MNENINLCELLKGHEGETFYSPALGSITLISIGRCDNDFPIEIHNGSEDVLLTSEGKLYNCDEAEVMLFPLRDQRDWEKWAEEQKPKVPKTWSEYLVQFKIESNPTLWFDSDRDWGNIGNSCSALFKIHKLIEVSYGGNITDKEWRKTSIKYTITCTHYGVLEISETVARTAIAFHTIKQAKDFTFYPENVQLLKDFYMI